MVFPNLEVALAVLFLGGVVQAAVSFLVIPDDYSSDTIGVLIASVSLMLVLAFLLHELIRLYLFHRHFRSECHVSSEPVTEVTEMDDPLLRLLARARYDRL